MPCACSLGQVSAQTQSSASSCQFMLSGCPMIVPFAISTGLINAEHASAAVHIAQQTTSVYVDAAPCDGHAPSTAPACLWM